MDGTTQVLTILIIVLVMTLNIIITQFVRRRRDFFVLRDIPAYRRLPMMVGEAVEANRPVHVSLGSAGLGGSSTILALASAELLYQVAERAVIGGVAPILTMSDTSAISLGQDTLRRAYASRNLTARYRGGSVRWYPGRSLAFAAALTATLGDDHVSSSVLAGSFGSELALVADAAARRDQGLLATSDQLEGQAVAYAMADPTLIGEELFAAGSYLGNRAGQVANTVTIDILRYILILALIVPVALAIGDAFLQGRFSAALQRLLGGG